MGRKLFPSLRPVQNIYVDTEGLWGEGVVGTCLFVVTGGDWWKQLLITVIGG